MKSITRNLLVILVSILIVTIFAPKAKACDNPFMVDTWVQSPPSAYMVLEATTNDARLDLLVEALRNGSRVRKMHSGNIVAKVIDLPNGNVMILEVKPLKEK